MEQNGHCEADGCSSTQKVTSDVHISQVPFFCRESHLWPVCVQEDGLLYRRLSRFVYERHFVGVVGYCE